MRIQHNHPKEIVRRAARRDAAVCVTKALQAEHGWRTTRYVHALWYRSAFNPWLPTITTLGDLSGPLSRYKEVA